MHEGTSWSGKVLNRQEAPAELIERGRDDRAAFLELFDFYVGRIFAFCRLHSADRQEAESLTAHTFERALDSLDRYSARDVSFSGWLLRIASSEITERGRQGSRLPSIFPRPRPKEEEDRVRQWEHAYRLRSYLAKLPEEQQEVVRLRFYDDQPFMAVAASLGQTETSVRQTLRHALRSLRVHMERGASDGG